MSLIGSLNIGKSALATHQAALQVTGNNIANAGNADYTRQVARITPNRDQQLKPGVFLGTGVNLTSVERQIDEALMQRIRAAVSENESAATQQQWLGRVEAIFNELSDEDLSTKLSAFFASWSNLANRPQDPSLRDIVITQGTSLAGWLRTTRQDLTNLQQDVDNRLTGLTREANALSDQVAYLNQQIVVAEGGGGGTANGLRDQRDAVLRQLSSLVDIRTVNDPSGMVNVYVGSEPLVVNAENRGLVLRQENIDGQLQTSVTVKATGARLDVTGGQIGALVKIRTETIGTVTDHLDALAGNLIFELNKLHASGQGTEGFAAVSSTTAVADAAAPLNSAAAGLPFSPVNGSFVVHVRDKSSGLVTSTLVQVDLDGQGAETSLNSLAASLNGIGNISASVAGGRLSLSTDSDRVEISFSQDSSGTLAALGINTFFSGRDASDVAVNPLLKSRPQLLAAALNGDAADNQTARAIAALQTATLPSLGGGTITQAYEAMINSVSVAAANARTNATASAVVTDTLQAQREALSGVSLDEEAVNLIKQQRAFQGAARLVAAIDEMMKTVLSLV